MGFLSDILGTNNSSQISNNGGAGAAPLIAPETASAANSAANGVSSGLGAQQNFAQALQAQNGINNQSNVYNQLQGVANGTGPNPAQAQLAQATGTNVANQSALMAGQRGAGSNVGLIARQAAQQGANTQQQSAGQAATLQAQQSLNALGQEGNIANQQVTNQANANNAVTQGNLSNQGQVLGQISNQNANNLAIQQGNANIAQQNAQANANVSGGLLGGLGAIGGALISKASNGGATDSSEPSNISDMADYLGYSANGGKAINHPKGKIPGKEIVKGNSPENDNVPVLLSAGEIVIPKTETTPKKAEKFVEKIQAEGKGGEIPSRNPGKLNPDHDHTQEFIKALKSSKGGKSPMEPTDGYARVLHGQRQLESRLKELETLAKRIKVK